MAEELLKTARIGFLKLANNPVLRQKLEVAMVKTIGSAILYGPQRLREWWFKKKNEEKFKKEMKEAIKKNIENLEKGSRRDDSSKAPAIPPPLPWSPPPPRYPVRRRTGIVDQTSSLFLFGLVITLVLARGVGGQNAEGSFNQGGAKNAYNPDNNFKKGNALLFVIGHSSTPGGILDKANIEAEERILGDFLRLDDVEGGYLELSAKTWTDFAIAVSFWDSDFYVKGDDDVHVNIDCEWKAQAGKTSVASFDWTCSSICRSDGRIHVVHQRCGEGDDAIWETPLYSNQTSGLVLPHPR